MGFLMFFYNDIVKENWIRNVVKQRIQDQCIQKRSSDIFQDLFLGFLRQTLV